MSTLSFDLINLWPSNEDPGKSDGPDRTITLDLMHDRGPCDEDPTVPPSRQVRQNRNRPRDGDPTLHASHDENKIGLLADVRSRSCGIRVDDDLALLEWPRGFK